MRRTLPRAAAVQVDSTEIEASLAARGLTVHYKPMTPLGLDAFLAAGERRTHRAPATRVLFVGRLGPQKRLGALLEQARPWADRRPALAS